MSRLRFHALLAVAAAIATPLLLAACEGQEKPAQAKPSATAKTAVLADADRGRDLFAAKCAACHGQGGGGTNQGLPLIHRIYEPKHHGDAAFYRAVAAGVRAHHWPFGDMPPIPGLGIEDVANIVAYVRREQQRAGIF